jgi:hypothetical protein
MSTTTKRRSVASWLENAQVRLAKPSSHCNSWGDQTADTPAIRTTAKAEAMA